MKIVSYTDPMTVCPGESVAVKVSAESDYRAECVRLIHGDRSPLGPGFKTQHMPSQIEVQQSLGATLQAEQSA